MRTKAAALIQIELLYLKPLGQSKKTVQKQEKIAALDWHVFIRRE